jgi:alpha-L-fucosidase
MVDIPLRGANGIHNWFWAPGQDSGVYSPAELVEMYYQSVGRNSNFIIGAVVDTTGLVPEIDCRSLKAFGDEIRRIFSDPVAITGGKGTKIVLKLPTARQIDHIVIQEDIRQGERVREYALESFTDGKWERLAEGTCIGHKRIHKLTPFQTEKIRLTISKSMGEPQIRTLAIYHAQ